MQALLPPFMANQAAELRELIESGRSPQRNTPYADAHEVRSLDRKGSTVILTVEQERPPRLLNETILQRSVVLHRWLRRRHRE